MENVIEILRVNWKQNLRYHVIGAVLFCLLIPFFFDINGMDLFSTAKVLEAYFILLGIICFVPVFLPDQDLTIRNLLDTKQMSAGIVCLIRFFQSLLLMVLLESAMLLFFRWKGAQFPFGPYFLGTAASMIFFGRNRNDYVCCLKRHAPCLYDTHVILCDKYGKRQKISWELVLKFHVSRKFHRKMVSLFYRDCVDFAGFILPNIWRKSQQKIKALKS